MAPRLLKYADMNEMDALEELLIRTMVRILSRDPDGEARIERALWAVQQAGEDLQKVH